MGEAHVMAPVWDISPITRRHERASFSSGEPALDDFLRRFARQNQDEDIGRTWVACLPGERSVLGFYALSASSVAFQQLPEGERRRLPQYPVPVAHLGRLAVDRRAQGQKLGETLLMHAIEQVARVAEIVAIRGVEVRAKHARARAFYERYGFVSMLDERHHLSLSIKVIRTLLRATD